MDQHTPDIETVQETRPSPGPGNGMAVVDVSKREGKGARSKEIYMAYTRDEDKPGGLEVWGWYSYGFCSYFILSVLVPVVFPLLISQVVPDPPGVVKEGFVNSKGLFCRRKEVILYQRLTDRSWDISGSKISALEWTSISWATGLLFAAPVLGLVSFHLDHRQLHSAVAATAIAFGAVFCLPAGFFSTPWIFLPYIAAVVAAQSVAGACHIRHLGLMIRGFTGTIFGERQFSVRRDVSGWLSVYGTVAGCTGSAIFAAFTFHMLREAPDHELTNLWVVSIFSGLIWLVGIFHVFSCSDRTSAMSISAESKSHAFSVFKYHHAVGSLVGVFLSSFTTMCIFSGAVLFLVGQLCLKPPFLLFFWLIYFMFPMFSLPLLQPLQHLIKADSVKMQQLGFILSAITTAAGFFYRNSNWPNKYVLILAAVQGTSTALLHAYSQILLLDCSPPNKEGAFSVWFSWMKAVGTFAGFTVASVHAGKLGASFGTAFLTSMLGVVFLIFANTSDLGGAVAAGHVREYSERGSPVQEVDTEAQSKDMVAVGNYRREI